MARAPGRYIILNLPVTPARHVADRNHFSTFRLPHIWQRECYVFPDHSHDHYYFGDFAPMAGIEIIQYYQKLDDFFQKIESSKII